MTQIELAERYGSWVSHLDGIRGDRIQLAKRYGSWIFNLGSYKRKQEE